MPLSATAKRLSSPELVMSPVVIVSLEDFESLRETAYLMRSPANARRLLDAMERLEAAQGEHH